MRESLRIDSPFMGLGCRRPILVTCGSALSQLWRPVHVATRGSKSGFSEVSVASAVKYGCSALVVSARGAPPRSRAAGSVFPPLEEFAVEICRI